MNLTHLDAPSKEDFREAMASMVAAVNVITTNGPGGRCGITATAVCSITDEPPSILICINRKSEMNQVFKENQQLCVNLLNDQHEAIAMKFAGMTDLSMEERFARSGWDDWIVDGESTPYLPSALANLRGVIQSMEEIGTHTIFIVRLESIIIRGEGNGLAYFQRNFHSIPR